ncbi:hypothetical protein K438DRAFT_1962545 [Mycena galopus ATCC 62051]|nr:hypothetical protein K438DRAFT_1905156 [Mycena galopus ATCC 62051]KAF8207636.1 hypothetical protein K438DRAFT_1962545 [Mycena galopus ATCC 62051]
MTSLCLACSSSLPPKSTEVIFTTQCCTQPICGACIQANPRLARYNPCLACLGGVAVVESSSKQLDSERNVDGAVREEDNFSIGDDEEEEEAEDVVQEAPVAVPVKGPPSEYYIKRSDTLQGIAMRFRGRTLCLLNNLPPSTLSTTPHLLHTRTSLVLPTFALSRLNPNDAAPPSPADARAREVSRAGKRLQTLTKTDWHIASAYIALADDPDEAASYALKQKELGIAAASPSLEAVAADQYLGDLEWEAEQLRAGRPPRIDPFPTAPIHTGGKAPTKSWW